MFLRKKNGSMCHVLLYFLNYILNVVFSLETFRQILQIKTFFSGTYTLTKCKLQIFQIFYCNIFEKQ